MSGAAPDIPIGSPRRRGGGGGVSPLPPGTPAWVTPELVAATLDCWQPHFPKALTTEDAVEIITNVGRLLDALGLTKGDAPAANSPVEPE